MSQQHLKFSFAFVSIVVLWGIGAEIISAGQPDNYRVLDAEKDGAPESLLQNYLMDQTRAHFAARRAAIQAIKTPEDFYARQKKIRRELFRINGPFPKRTPLNAITTGTIDRDGYTIENVIYESRPDHHVTANLYLPNDLSKPIPGVLIPCGHSSNGKAAGAYQSIAISLAKNGMAALVYDPIGQGERHQLLDENDKPTIKGTTEHTLIGVGAWLVGLGTANYRIWDGIRSLDYLAERPEINAKRLGCTGNSGGGTMTSYLMAFDPRIKAAAPSCYLTTLERLFDTIGPQDAEQNFPGQVALGIDHADYIAIRAPKPTLMCVATQDFFDIDGAWQTFREAKGVYGLLGQPERMNFIEYNDKHGFSRPRRQAAMRFMRRWLLRRDDNPEEPELKLSSDAELQCTHTGEVLADYRDGVSVFSINRQRAEQLKNQRDALWNKSKKKALATVQQLTGIRTDEPVPDVISRGTIKVGNDSDRGWTGTIDKLVISRPHEVPMPALLFVPEGAKSGTAVVYASSAGKATDAGAEGEITNLLNDGKIVLSIDVRGFGETAASKNRDRRGFFGTDFKTALLSIHLNRPLLGQRTEDILAAVNFLDALNGIRSIEVVGIELCGPVALHAAAFDKRIKQVTVVRSIKSWSDVVATPLAKDQLTNVVPFALERYDLPNLVEAIAPRPVEIREPVKE